MQVQYHSDGRSAGHGVVIYENIEDAERALLATDGYRLEGRTIEVGGGCNPACVCSAGLLSPACAPTRPQRRVITGMCAHGGCRSPHCA